MNNLSLEEIKNAELQMLIVFHKYCEENHLRYTLAGGTLLGAIRHKGFIPWDDDIDVYMPRSDYELLRLQLSNKYLKENYYLFDYILGNENKIVGYPFL